MRPHPHHTPMESARLQHGTPATNCHSHPAAGRRQIGAAGMTAARRSTGVSKRDPFDIAALFLLAALVVFVLASFRQYAISNDEPIQHRYGELIFAYYASGL